MNDDQIPLMFRGIRKFIQLCHNLNFSENPDYLTLQDLIKSMFDDQNKVLNEL